MKRKVDIVCNYLHKKETI